MTKRGFTLVEILTVIAIMGILTSLAAYAWGSATKRSRNSTRKADIERIRGVLQQYYTDKRSYPKLEGTSYVAHCAFGGQLKNYLDPIPKDPKNSASSCSLNSSGRYHNFYLYFPEGANATPITYPKSFTLGMALEGEREFVGDFEGFKFTGNQETEPDLLYNFTTIVTGRSGR